MPASQFDNPAKLRPDGVVLVTGTFSVPNPDQEVESRFLIVQNEVAAEGKGSGGGGTWAGKTDQGMAEFEAGQALAIGLAFHARKEPGRGFETLTWSAQIELEGSGRDR
jgi:hypothetical protein